jgi:hypothetical protein
LLGAFKDSSGNKALTGDREDYGRIRLTDWSDQLYLTFQDNIKSVGEIVASLMEVLLDLL